MILPIEYVHSFIFYILGLWETTMVFKFDNTGFHFVSSTKLAQFPDTCQVCPQPPPTPTPSPVRLPQISANMRSVKKYSKSASQVVLTSIEDELIWVPSLLGDITTKLKSMFGISPTIPGRSLYTPNTDDDVVPTIHHISPIVVMKNLPTEYIDLYSSPEITFDLPVKLYDKAGNGSAWFAQDYSGAYYYVTDFTRKQLQASGSNCGKDAELECIITLSAGQYYFRVGGAGDKNKEDVSWSFCGIVGTAQQELSFTVKNGTCISGMLQSFRSVCDNSAKTSVTMEGQLILSNLIEDTLSTFEQHAIETAVASVMHLSDSNQVAVIEACSTSSGVFCHNYVETNYNRAKRQLIDDTSITTGVRFTVSMVVQDFGVDGTLLYDVLDFMNTTSSQFSRALLAGILQSEIRSLASMMHTDNLQYVRVEDGLPLVTTSISYVATNIPTSVPSFAPGGSLMPVGSKDASVVSVSKKGNAENWKEIIALIAVSLSVALVVFLIFIALQRLFVDSRTVVKKPRRKGQIVDQIVNGSNSTADGSRINRKVNNRFRPSMPMSAHAHSEATRIEFLTTTNSIQDRVSPLPVDRGPKKKEDFFNLTEISSESILVSRQYAQYLIHN